MGSEIDVIQYWGNQGVVVWCGSMVVAISHLVNGMKLRKFKFCSCINNWELNPQHPIISCYHKQVLGLYSALELLVYLLKPLLDLREVRIKS